MGTFSIGCLLQSQQDRTRSVSVAEVMVDTGSELTWISAETLESIGVVPERRNQRFVMANGQISRSISFAIIRVGENLTTDEVVFAEGSDMQLLGARPLEGLNLRVDSHSKKLVAAGPLVAAGNRRHL
ncbi:MAG: hypothetical protein OXH09_00225 [Gammaproteobacteria bacterium]|nr:hypothetical protein [Gammaproteobacteria bacterium]